MADHDIHIVIAQLNFTVGDIENNTKKIIEAIKAVVSCATPPPIPTSVEFLLIPLTIVQIYYVFFLHF